MRHAAIFSVMAIGLSSLVNGAVAQDGLSQAQRPATRISARISSIASSSGLTPDRDPIHTPNVSSALAAGAQPAKAAAAATIKTTADPDDFTFRRVRVAAISGKRITVQIDPQEQARILARRPSSAKHPDLLPAPGPVAPTSLSDAGAASALGSYGWFWDQVPTRRAAGDGRMARALGIISHPPKGAAAITPPRLRHLQRIVESHGRAVLQASVGTRVSPALVLALISVESAGDPDATSPAGARGLMQLMPATASRFGVGEVTDPAQNIRGGVAYLDWLMRKFDGDPLMVLAGYNAGEGAVLANDGVPPYAETRDYVPKVLAAWQVAQGLCQTPPELMSDPCVFRQIEPARARPDG